MQDVACKHSVVTWSNLLSTHHFCFTTKYLDGNEETPLIEAL